MLKRPIHVPIPMCAFASLVAVDVAVNTSEPGMNENGAVVVTVTRTAFAVEGSSGATVQLLSIVNTFVVWSTVPSWMLSELPVAE